LKTPLVMERIWELLSAKSPAEISLERMSV
jgi:hypothetical protein